MKLKNKKTGEIINAEGTDAALGEIRLWDSTNHMARNFSSISALNEEWEDVEKPKNYYWVSPLEQGIACDKDTDDGVDEMNKEIGNYFGTEEEAEKAVEKLKAWKRLKDKGFRFIDHIDRDSGQGMTRYEWDGYVNGEDLDLLFSREDD